MRISGIANFRRRLANPEAALPYAILGLAAGAITAILMIAFRLMLEWPLAIWLPGNNAENFEDLPRHWHFILPVSGGLLLGILLSLVTPSHRFTGIPHVIAALHNGRGRLPLKNIFVQFIGGLIALLSGQSGGREGPAVHIGAGASSQVGAKLKLPNNSLRVMTACGTSAAIAASFNTPIAGVIFAMEVVMMEYTVAGFIPVILAAVTATTLSQAVFGAVVFLPSSQVTMTSLLELPFIALLGCLGGVLSSTFVLIQQQCLRMINRPAWLRLALAGIFTGLCALLAPEVLGIGYDSLQATLTAEFSTQFLVLLLALKLAATAVACGLGMPVGIIGPSLLVGAFAGGAIGDVGALFFPNLAAEHSFYVLIGMAAVMGAILNAPLAALLAIIELTHNLNIIFPAMLAVTAAHLIHKELFGLQSAHQTTLLAMQQAVRSTPLTLALLRTSAAALMDRNLRHVTQHLSTNEQEKLLETPVRWLVISNAEGQRIIVHREHWFPLISSTKLKPEQTIDLLAVLEHRRRTALFDINGTLMEALETMNEEGLDSLFVYNPHRRQGPPDEGIITREGLSDHYNLPIRF